MNKLPILSTATKCEIELKAHETIRGMRVPVTLAKFLVNKSKVKLININGRDTWGALPASPRAGRASIFTATCLDTKPEFNEKVKVD